MQLEVLEKETIGDPSLSQAGPVDGLSSFVL